MDKVISPKNSVSSYSEILEGFKTIYSKALQSQFHKQYEQESKLTFNLISKNEPKPRKIKSPFTPQSRINKNLQIHCNEAFSLEESKFRVKSFSPKAEIERMADVQNIQDL